MIPITENPLVLRTDFANAEAWNLLCAKISEPVGEDKYLAYVEFVSDPQFEGLTAPQLLRLVPEPYPLTTTLSLS